MITSTQLSAIVQAAKAIGERQLTTQLPDGTIIEIHLTEHPKEQTNESTLQPDCPPLALLIQRAKSQTAKLKLLTQRLKNQTIQLN